MIRLRVAGGSIASEWVPTRWERGTSKLHAIVDDSHWNGKLFMETAVIVDLDINLLEDAALMNLHDVLHALIERRGPATEAEVQVMHDAVEAHATGLNDSEDMRKRREAAAASGLAEQFSNVSDQELLERAADGDVLAQQERQRRKVMADLAPAKGPAVTPTPTGAPADKVAAEKA